MAQDIKEFLARNQRTLLADAIGGVALCSSFLMALWLPGMF
ncbi:hypothetical protein [Thioclava atlantica]|nr:hypothetical protein [Thioclava atlantica]